MRRDYFLFRSTALDLLHFRLTALVTSCPTQSLAPSPPSLLSTCNDGGNCLAVVGLLLTGKQVPLITRRLITRSAMAGP